MNLLNFNKNIYCFFKAIAPILLEDMRKVAVDKKGKMNKCIFLMLNWELRQDSLFCLKINNVLKFSDGDGPNLCRVNKEMLVPHLLKIYFGLGWPLSVLEIVSLQRLKTNCNVSVLGTYLLNFEKILFMYFTLNSKQYTQLWDLSQNHCPTKYCS